MFDACSGDVFLLLGTGLSFKNSGYHDVKTSGHSAGSPVTPINNATATYFKHSKHLKMTVSWNVVLCRLVKTDQHFRYTH